MSCLVGSHDGHVTRCRCTSVTMSGARGQGAIVPVAVTKKMSFPVIGRAVAVVSDLSGW